MWAVKGLSMEKWLCWASMGVAGLLLIIFLLDVILGIPFGGTSVVVDVFGILASAIILYLAFDAFRDVEDEVDVGFGEHSRQIGRRFEVDDDMTLARERVGDRDDGLRRIPLGFVVAVCGALDVVREANADRLRLALLGDAELARSG